MKTWLVVLLLGSLSNSALAQKIIENVLPCSPGQRVTLQLKFADSIQVRYWDKPAVSVRIAVSINNGRLNDALRVDTVSTEEEVRVETDFDQERIRQGKAEDCAGQSSGWNTDLNGTRYSVCSEINYRVYLPRKARLRVETISGNIFIEGASDAVTAKTISGYVDMNWPGGKGATLALKTITGEVYSDLDIAFMGKREKHPLVGYLLEGTLRGGGPTVRLESISNNIYLRQQK